MSKYEQLFGTDWERLDEDEGMRRAYALGVASSLGEYHPNELDAIRGQMDTAYSRSVIDLAFEEGKNESRKLSPEPSDHADTVWKELVEGEYAPGDDEETPTGGLLGLPGAIDRMKALERQKLDSTDAVEMPDFLMKD